MSYLEDFNKLNDLYKEDIELINIPESRISIRNYKFFSDDNEYYPPSEYLSNSLLKKLAELSDSALLTKAFLEKTHIAETYNRKFIFPLYTYPGKSSKLIILFHGLNEGGWEKYHSWAKRLVELTSQSVLMFPISHHINRRPADWIASRTMNALGKERQKLFGAKECSFLNSAISTRLHLCPENFFWSGLRSFYDVQKLIKEIRDGNYETVDKDCSISLFGYSIGAFLIEALLMARRETFENTKSVLFCGGLTMDKMNLSSKFICDTVSRNSIMDFYADKFEEYILKDKYLKKYFMENEEEGLVFRSLLNSNRFSDFRTGRLKYSEEKILAIPLKNDVVAPAEAVRSTLTENGLKVTVEEMHTNIDYDHILPFPVSERVKEETDEWFGRVFSRAAEWLE